MLRKIRVILAVVCFLAIAGLFLIPADVVPEWLGCLAKVQFLPAVLAGSVGVIVGILVVTLLLGRIYCSVVCPLGVMQDGFGWIGAKVKKNRHHFTKPKTWLRWTVLVVFVLLMVFGLNQVALLIAPYSAFGRIVSLVIHASTVTLVVGLVTLAVVGFMAFRGGRTWCNTVCPVGTVLGLVSRCSLFRPEIDVDKCTGCTLCARNCKSSCINPETHTIDYSRCVACMDCVENCKQGAITYKLRTKKQKAEESKKDTDPSRRQFVTAVALTAAAATVRAEEKKVDGGLAVIEDKQVPERHTPLHPAGSVSLRNFSNHCTACQLCVSACPNGVLRPSSDISRLMQPEMSYEKGFCRPECTRCSNVCPTGAIRPIDIAEKSSIHIGKAVVVLKNCIANTDGVLCGNCARHCPAGAVIMVPRTPGDNPDLPMTVKVPTVDESRCIGCGACEYLCPSRPFSAIYVEGRETHVIG